MTGKVNIGAQLTEAAYDKYLKDVDGVDSMAQGYAPNGPFRYLLGSNDDTLNMAVTGGVAADTDFRMDIDAGAGNDLVNFSFNFPHDFAANQLKNQMALKNVSVNLGAGDDTFHFWGNGAMDVSDGAGNDALYVGQNASTIGAPGAVTAASYNAVWVFNVEDATQADQTGIFIGPDGAQSLENNLLGGETSFTYSGAGTGADRSFLKAEVTFKGIKATATLELKPGDGQLSDTDINHLLIKAINEDATLSKLLLAKDGAGSSLLVEALYNGEMTNGDLAFAFSAVKQDGTVAGVTLDSMLLVNGAYDMNAAAGGKPHGGFASEGLTAGLFTGSNASTDSATTIHMGLGNDVIALNAADGKDTLVLNGAFDHDVVMNFTTAKDQINVKNFTASHVDTITGEGIDVTAANFGLNGTAISATAGKSLLVLKNTATDENDYWFFEVNSSTGGHLAAEDKITLLGSITLGDGDTLDAADIHLV